MEPTLRDGDLLLVLWNARGRPGRMAVVDLPGGRPMSVKRLAHRQDGGWWVDRDNPAEGVDSWVVGVLPPHAVRALVLARLPSGVRWRWRRLRLPRRPRAWGRAPAAGTRGCAPRAGRRSPGPAVPSSTITPSSMKTTRSATSRAKPISWVTTIIVIPSSASRAHDGEHVPDELGVERGGRLVEEHQLAGPWSAPGRWPPAAAGRRRAAPGRRRTLSDRPDPRQVAAARRASASDCLRPSTRRWAMVQVAQHGEVREQVELLEDHADRGGGRGRCRRPGR